MLLHGIFPPLTTPFYPDESVYFKKLEHNVAQMSKTPVAGLVLLGTTGEAIMLSDQERRDVLRVARETAEPEKVLIAGCGSESVHETVALCEYAANLDYDAALIRTPHFYKNSLSSTAVLTYYRTVADRSPLPIILYNIPQCTGYELPVDVVVELALHQNIIAIKESSGNVEKIRTMAAQTRHIEREATVTEVFSAVTKRMLQPAPASVENQLITAAALTGAAQSGSLGAGGGVAVLPQIKTRTKAVGFQVLCGSAETLLDSLQAGAVGGILAFACPAPTACYQVYTAFKEGNEQLAREKQQLIAEAARKVGGRYGVPGVKCAMDLRGYYGGPSRLPLLSATADMKREIEQLMRGISA